MEEQRDGWTDAVDVITTLTDAIETITKLLPHQEADEVLAILGGTRSQMERDLEARKGT